MTAPRSTRVIGFVCIVAAVFAHARVGAAGPTLTRARGRMAQKPAEVAEPEVRAVLRQYCFACHGQEAREAGLDLRTVKLMLAGGESGPALVPGKPGKSLLLDMVSEGHMPPEGEMLTREEIDLLVRWIAQGAN